VKEIREDFIEFDLDNDIIDVLIDRLRRSEEYFNIDEHLLFDHIKGRIYKEKNVIYRSLEKKSI
jgi:hypothetical protein